MPGRPRTQMPIRPNRQGGRSSVTAEHKPVHEDLYPRPGHSGGTTCLVEIDDLLTDDDPENPFLLYVLQRLDERLLRMGRERERDEDPQVLSRLRTPFSQGSLHRSRRNRRDDPPAIPAVRPPHPREEKPEVVVHLGRRPDGGPGDCGCSFSARSPSPARSPDRSTSGLSIRSRNCLAYEERLSTYLLVLPHKSCQRQGRLAGTLTPVMTTSRSLGDVDADVFQIVNPRTADDDRVFHGPALVEWLHRIDPRPGAERLISKLRQMSRKIKSGGCFALRNGLAMTNDRGPCGDDPQGPRRQNRVLVSARARRS